VRPRRLFASAVATVAALTWPAGALARAVRNPLVATNFEARVAAVRIDRGAVPAKVVDGDRQLWLCVRAGVAGRWSVPFSIKPAQEDTPKADVQSDLDVARCSRS
jgi:hypothetical protein